MERRKDGGKEKVKDVRKKGMKEGEKNHVMK